MTQADPVITSTMITGVVMALLGVFSGGTIVALFRVGPDRNKIVIEAAQGAVIVQTSVIDELQKERAEMRAELARVKTDLEQIRAREAELAAENAALRRRVAAIEDGGRAS